MAVQDWSTNPDSNTTVGGIFIGEGCPPSNLNNAERQIMAEARSKFDDIDAKLTPIASGAIADIAALSPAANTFPYFTSPTGAALAAITDITRGLLAAGTADAARSAISAAGYGTYNPIRNGVMAFNINGVQFIIQFGYSFTNFGPGQYDIAFNQPFQAGCFVSMPWAISGGGNGTVAQVAGPQNDHFTIQVSGSTLAGIGWIAIGR